MRKSLQPLLLFFLIVGVFFSACTNEQELKDYSKWSSYLGDKQSTQYSSLDQIHKGNVDSLVVAWEYKTGDSEGRQIQCSPLIIDSVLYATTGGLKCVALNAATGNLIWEFDPYANTSVGGGNNRGLAYWSDGSSARIFHSAGSGLYALDAQTGKPVSDFGVNGRVDLHTGLGERAKDLWVIMTTPGVVYEDLYIVGSRVSEGYNSAPGYIRAFDVRSGKLEWTFHTIPKPGEEGYETWPPNAWERIGGVNSWAGMALDEEKGIVYVPTGSAAFDSYGGNRIGENLFANCLLALDASTGERIWHFQTIRHDIWDYDLPSPPNIVDLTVNGEKIPAVVQTTKTGNTFVFNRYTGEPLFPLKEIEIPPSDIPGEEAWPTQPLPVLPPPFTRQNFTRDLITDRSPEAHEAISKAFDTLRGGRMMIPPSFEGTLVFPGFDGGAEWGGSAVDPYRGILYVNSNEMVWTVQIIENDKYLARLNANASAGQALYNQHCAVCHGPDLKGDGHYGYPALVGVSNNFSTAEVKTLIESGKGMMPGMSYLGDEAIDQVTDFLFGLEDAGSAAGEVIANEEERFAMPYGIHGFRRLFDPEGYPAIKPPWGNLTAIDLNKGEILWQVPLGEFKELTEQGYTVTGTENYGGPVVTGGGLIFIAATRDEMFRAFDKDNGELLWEVQLPAGGYATPATYRVNGKQFLVIACGGDKMGTKSGDSYVCFSLP